MGGGIKERIKQDIKKHVSKVAFLQDYINCWGLVDQLIAVDYSYKLMYA